ncbi:MAG: hypothetical protein WCI72_06840 [archaeon]
MQVKYLQSLHDADRHLKVAEYLLDVTLKLMNDNRILAKCLIELQKTATSLIDALLYLEAKRGEILPASKEEKAKLFFSKEQNKYMNSVEVEEIKKILIFTKKHKEAHLEFVKKEKLVIFGSKECKILTESGLKNSIILLKRIISRFDQKTQDINTPFFS